MLLQDTSSSFKEDKPNMVKTLPKLFDTIDREYPGTIYSLNSFTDIPIPPFGCWRNDNCFHPVQTWTQNSTLITEAVSALQEGWGNDFKEASLMALGHVAAGKLFKRDIISTEGTKMAKIVLLSTDAGYHFFEGDLVSASIVDMFNDFFFIYLIFALDADAGSLTGTFDSKSLKKECERETNVKNGCCLSTNFDDYKIIDPQYGSFLHCGRDKDGKANFEFEDYPEVSCQSVLLM